MNTPRALTLTGLSLSAALVASSADAHLMVAQHGTLNLVGDGAFMVLSLPATAFPRADDDHDGRIARGEFERHYRDIAAAVSAGVSLVDADGSHAPEGVLLSLSPDDATPLAPAPQLVALGRIAHPHPDQPATLRVALFGADPTTRNLEVLVTRGDRRRVLVFNPDERARALFPTASQTFTDAVRRGVGHILAGYDHLLFLGVTLVGAASWRRVLLALTTFTVGHAVTLGLSVAGRVAVSSAVVEPAIAATLIGMALLDAVAHARKVEVDARLRMGLVFGCALIHGLGFAGALRDLGIEPDDRLPLVAGFNLGIELGQVAAAAVALAAAWALGRRLSAERRGWARQAARGVVLVAGVAWLVARLTGA